MKVLGMLIAIFALLSCACHADESDATLLYYLSKSDLVVLGSIVTVPSGSSFHVSIQESSCDFEISDVLKGDPQFKGSTIKVNIKRYLMDKKDLHPLIEKDAECILFLKKASGRTIPQWVTADFWFGIQHPFPWLAKSLKRLAEEQDGRTKPSTATE